MHVPLAAASNTVANSSFEEGTSEWNTNSSSVVFEVVNTPTVEGTSSAKLTYSKTTSFGIEQLIEEIQPDQSYVLSGYLFAASLPDKAYMRIAWYQSTDGSGSQISTSDTPLLSEVSMWQQLSTISSAPINARSAKLRILVSNGVVFADSIQLHEYIPTTTPTPSPTTTPTPSSTPTFTPSPTPTQSSSGTPIQEIYISEFLPQPETGETEWIELYNAYATEVTLTNWYLDDTTDAGSSPRSFSLTIPAKGYKIVRLSSSMLNNADDVARLLNNSKTQIDAVEYSESERGLSIGWSEVLGATYCSQEKTPDAPNAGCTHADRDVMTSSTSQALKPLSPTPLLSDNSLNTGTSALILQGRYSINAKLSDHDDSINSSEIHNQNLRFGNNSTTPPAPLPIAAYTLLSILSIAAKMKIEI